MKGTSGLIKPENTQADAQSSCSAMQSMPSITINEESEHRYRRLQQQNRTIIYLSTHPTVAEGQLDKALGVILQAATEAIQTTQAKIWRYDSDEDMCCCLASFETGYEPCHCEYSLEIQKYPEYFAALQGGLVLEIQNVKDDPRTASLTGDYWQPQHIASGLMAPVRIQGQVAGLICFEHVLQRAWYPEEVTFAGQIAALAAQVFLNADIRRRAHELSIITHISREIASVHNLHQVLLSIAHHASEISLADVGGVFVCPNNGDLIAVGYSIPDTVVETLCARNAACPQSEVIARALTGHPIQIADLTLHPEDPAYNLTRQEGIHALLVVPLISQNAVIGGIMLGHRTPRHFSSDTVAFLQALAQQSANAVENARLFASLREEKALLETLYQFGQHTIRSHDVGEVAQRALNEICQLLEVPKGIILLQNGPGTEMLHCIAAVGIDTDKNKNPLHTLRVEDVLKENWPATYFEDAQATISVNMHIGDQQAGVLTLFSTVAGYFGEDRLRFLELAAAAITGALRNARSFEEQRTQREMAEALAEAATVLGSTLDLEQVLDRILEQAARVVNGDIFNILLIFGEEGRFVRWRGYERFGIASEDIAGSVVPVFQYPRLVQMIETKEPVLVHNINEDPGWVRTRLYHKYLQAYVAAPILVADKVEGFLNVNGKQPDQFTERDAQRLKAFAGHAAVAIHNARLYQQQLKHTDRLEQEVRNRTAQLEAQNAWLQAILSSTTDGIIVTDGAGTIVQQNRVVDAWLNETLSSEDAKCLCDKVHEIAQHAKERPETVLELTGLDLQLNAAPISAQGAEGAAIVIAAHDVSYLKALDRMKSRFVSNVSHELRTPLTSIRLYTALIRTCPPERRDQYLNSLEEEASRLSSLVADVLQISRIESGGLTPEIQSLDLNVLTEAVVASHMVLAESKGLNLTYHANAHQTLVQVDPDKFVQVLNNLIENAIHYTPNGGHIQVIADQVHQDEHAWGIVIVQDTGIGIPEEEQPHVFERFFRGEGPRTMQIPGSGLGLAIVKEILELHGGDIGVESSVGSGSKFTVRVPLVPAID
ncbi:MAG: GAF domain-containing protein [Anaerolineae bacterium]|nr:GAF domain-containing protein [Anaerolineae bacterium]